MKKFGTFIMLSLSIYLVSCEKMVLEEEMATTDPQTNFEYLWEQCSEKYAYFGLKNVDWDQVKMEYATKIHQGMSQDSLFHVLGSMLNELKDDHTNLKSQNNMSFFGVERLGPDSFDWRIISDNYLDQDYYTSGPFLHDFLANEQIGYIRFPSFTGTDNDKTLDFIMNRYKNTKGLIIDIRANGGGSISSVGDLISRFIDEKTLVYYSRTKAGPGRDDFSEAIPVYVTPAEGVRYQNKVIFLTDRGSYSASSFAALASKALPNVILMGDTTGGGLGIPNGGQLPNGWIYRFSVTQTLSLDKSPDYENGVPPDIHVSFDWNDLEKDEILERAIRELL